MSSKFRIYTADIATADMTPEQKQAIRSLHDSTIFVDNRRWGPATFQPHALFKKCVSEKIDQDVNEEEKALTVALIKYADLHRSEPYIRSLASHDCLLTPKSMKAGLFPVDGDWIYLEYRDPRYQAFMLDMNKVLRACGVPLSARGRLLVPWDKITPYSNELFFDKERIIPREYMLSATERAIFIRKAWGRFWRNYNRFDRDKYNFTLKKFTSPGPDLIDSQGVLQSREEMRWHKDIPGIELIYRYDYSRYKKALLEEPGAFNSLTLLEKQLEVSNKGGITPDNLAWCLNQHLVNQSVYLERFTSLDPVMEDDPNLKWSQFTTKPRQVSFMEHYGTVTSIIPDMTRFTREWNEADPTKQGATARVRFANAMAQNKLYGYMPLFHAWLEELESGDRGFPSLNEKVMDRINRFCQERKEWTIKLFVGDRSASDKTITANPGLLLDVYDPDLREWREKTYGRTLMTSHAGGRCTNFAQASGHPGTTFDTHLPGMSTAIHLVAEWAASQGEGTLETNFEAICAAYYDENSDGVAHLGKIDVLPTMVSDDIKWWVATTRSVDWTLDQRELDATWMKAEFTDRDDGFGTIGDSSGIRPNPGLAVQRLWNGEMLGLSCKDGSSTYEKFSTLPMDIQKEVDDVHFFHFKCHMTSYARFESEYTLLLTLLGLERFDLVNTFSPVQVALYKMYAAAKKIAGKWVASSTSQSTAVDVKVKERCFSILDSFFNTQIRRSV